MSNQLTAAYSICRGIARTQAKNFYYGFLALPKEKRDGLCAVYAFMRHADDIVDDENAAPELRRHQLSTWLDTWHRATAVGETDDPVFFALMDTQKRFRISTELLDLLVQGTAMDLELPAPGQDLNQPSSVAAAVQTRTAYRTFEDLYRYCYYVASVVGLVCIKIFGYEDAKAELLAERCGIAFQLTNIIRDAKEDALNGRVYLPEEDLLSFDLTREQILSGNMDRASLRALLQFESNRAAEYYKSGYQLIPLIDEDSQAGLWILVTIYRRLLDEIAKKQFDVFAEKIRLSAARKLGILVRGIVQKVLL